VGKTTLFKAYEAAENGRLLLSAEVARWYLRGIPDERKFTYVIQAGLQDAIMRQESEIGASGKGVILCDRSVLDAVSYLRAWGDIADSQKLFERVRSWAASYAHFFLFDPEDVPYFNDDVRTENVIVRNRMHETFKELLDEYELPYQLLSGSITERKAIVDDKVAELLKAQSSPSSAVSPRIR